MKSKVVICDLDGCIIETFHLFNNTNGMSEAEKWDYFNRNANNFENPINYELVELLEKLKFFAKYKIIFLTSRSDLIYRQTLLNLKRIFAFEEFELFMRHDGDFSPSYEVKERILKELKEKYEIICAIDDDGYNCKMFKDNGIFTMQVV